MLFNGQAIFGIVDFGGDVAAVRCRAENILHRARTLGVEAQYRSVGRALLGRVGDQEPPVVSERDDLHAIIVGELCDRDRTEKTFGSASECIRFLSDGHSKGMNFLGRLDGTFAAAFWEQGKERLVLTCDPRADARLFYKIDGDQLIFSSWLRLISGPSTDIDFQAVQEFLRFLYVSPPRTIYKSISSLQAGHYLKATRSGVEVHKLPVTPEKGDADPRDLQPARVLENFERLFKEAVSRRIGQRRVGVFLSSGLDSATLTGVCQSVNPGRVEAFTVGFDDSELDETHTAGSLARHIGVPHSELKFDLGQYRDAFDRMARGFDQPFGDPAGLPLILGSQSVQGRVDVITGGVGGDDLFGTVIPRHLRFSSSVSAKLPPGVRKLAATSLSRIPFRHISRYAALFDFDEIEELFVTWPGWRKKELKELLGTEANFAESGFYRTFRAHRKQGAQKLFDAMGFFPPDDCRFEAAALAYMPIEMPYHDANLNAYVRGLPQSFRATNGNSKILLRELFCRYFPAQMLLAKKHYFNIPLQQFLARSDYEIVRTYLTPEYITRVGLVDSDRVRPWIDRFLAGDESLRFKIWALLVLHAWVGAHSA